MSDELTEQILLLLGQAETAPYSWSGRFESLDEQVFHSIRSTMATDHPIDEAAVKAIAMYIRTLPAPPSLLAAREKLAAVGQNRTEVAGRQLAEPAEQTTIAA